MTLWRFGEETGGEVWVSRVSRESDRGGRQPGVDGGEATCGQCAADGIVFQRTDFFKISQCINVLTAGGMGGKFTTSRHKVPRWFQRWVAPNMDTNI